LDVKEESWGGKGAAGEVMGSGRWWGLWLWLWLWLGLGLWLLGVWLLGVWCMVRTG